MVSLSLSLPLPLPLPLPLSSISQSDCSQDLPMLNELILLAYGEEVLTSNPVAVPPLTMATSTNLQDNLIQDCMWSSHLCDRSIARKPPPPLPALRRSLGERGGGVYTPAPSPPPPPGVAAVVGGDSSHDDEGMESDCVSPSAVFPSLLTPPASGKILTGVGSKVESALFAMETTEATSSPTKKALGVVSRCKSSDDPDWEESGEENGGRHGYERGQRRKRKLSTAAVGTGANSRHQPQSESSSTSGERVGKVGERGEREREWRERERGGREWCVLSCSAGR